jgi:hypothetical protein
MTRLVVMTKRSRKIDYSGNLYFTSKYCLATAEIIVTFLTLPELILESFRMPIHTLPEQCNIHSDALSIDIIEKNWDGDRLATDTPQLSLRSIIKIDLNFANISDTIPYLQLVTEETARRPLYAENKYHRERNHKHHTSGNNRLCPIYWHGNRLEAIHKNWGSCSSNSRHNWHSISRRG